MKIRKDAAKPEIDGLPQQALRLYGEGDKTNSKKLQNGDKIKIDYLGFAAFEALVMEDGHVPNFQACTVGLPEGPGTDISDT